MRIGLLKRLLHGLAAIEKEVAAERGEFSLFALIEKEEWDEYSPVPTGSSWRLYVAAPWIWADEMAAFQCLHEKVRPYEAGWNPFMRSLSIWTVPANSPHLDEVWEYCDTADGMVEVYNVDILDVTALRGYIFASRRPAELPQVEQPTAAAR